jgi:hypothetical protein
MQLLCIAIASGIVAEQSQHTQPFLLISTVGHSTGHSLYHLFVQLVKALVLDVKPRTVARCNQTGGGCHADADIFEHCPRMSTFDRGNPVHSVRCILTTARKSHTRVGAQTTAASEDATFFPAMEPMIVKVSAWQLHKQAFWGRGIPPVLELVNTAIILQV